jgi:hypothetical protein
MIRQEGIMIRIRKCKICGLEKGKKFTTNSRSCKDCSSWFRHCSTCKKALSIDMFSGRNTRCNKCANQANKKRYNTFDGRIKQLVSSAKYRARKKGIPFSISENWVVSEWDEAGGKCAATGLNMRAFGRPKKRGHLSLSLDQIDPSKGYTKNNTRLVCWGFNRLKGNSTDEEVYLIASRFCTRYKLLQKKLYGLKMRTKPGEQMDLFDTCKQG